jgi:hypothetical protein
VPGVLVASAGSFIWWLLFAVAAFFIARAWRRPAPAIVENNRRLFLITAGAMILVAAVWLIVQSA